MRRSLVWISLGLTLAVLGAISLEVRPPLHAQQAIAPVAANAISGAFMSMGAERFSTKAVVYLPPPRLTAAELKTRMKLQEKIPMNFPDNTSLEEVKKFIEQATIDKTDFPEGIPIYVDPLGLQDADKTMASTISLKLTNIPLETTLGLLLKRLLLTYWVNNDGLVVITSSSAEHAILTQSDIDEEILTNLALLRTEVKELREELRASRGSVRPVKEPTVGIPRIPQQGFMSVKP